jgi:hypothetical protein
MKSVRLSPLAVFALLIGQMAIADVVRHATIPASLRGTWALNLDDCNNADKIIVLSAKGRDSSEVKCTVDWVSETPGARGSIFVAHLHLPQDCKRFGQYDRQRYPCANGRQPGFGRPRFQQPQKLPALPCNHSCNLPIGSGDLIVCHQMIDLRGDLTRERMETRLRVISDRRDPNATVSTLMRFVVESGKPGAISD